MKETLEKLYSKAALSKDEAKALFLRLLDPATNQAQISSILTCYRMRLPDLDELEGFREGALQDSIKINFPGIEACDVCGTGGDNKSTFNISTLSAVVVAACGVPVAKHGGGAVSSKVGSSNLLETLGYKFTTDNEKLKRQIEETGLCFLHAPLFLPSFKNVAGVRKDLGVRTLFNMLGPVLNPSSPEYQVIGVYGLELLKLYTYLGQRLGKNYTIIHTLDGCDEVSLTSDLKVSSLSGEKIISAGDFGLEATSYEEIREGDDISSSAGIFKNVLENKATKAQTNVVIANSALVLYQVDKMKGKHPSLQDCVGKAREAIKSGRALKTFSSVLEISKV